ncbi:helix-turn-helix domain-containing protein [Paenibacillus tengchongensis]|uniref:helix-turn-helix domain-containing protein n=1 Tax=Paenibacillus tengchongensis TaxID=2608684 RepID=UPI00124E95BC|nr:helix-turn-helix domain-containing protein [Paenibacillus tengchongensis]
MPVLPAPPVPLRSLLFQLAEAHHVVQPLSCGPLPSHPDCHTLIVVAAGSGLLRFGGRMMSIHADMCYLPPAGAPHAIEAESGMLDYWVFRFRVLRAADEVEPYTGELFPGKIELLYHPFNKIIRLAQETAAISPEQGHEVDQLKRQLKFQELLLLLFEHHHPSCQVPSPAQAVESTVQYIQENYTENVTVKQLAEMAGVSPWQYTPIFQKLTGRKPLDYLAEQRIERSKQYLQETAEPVREVARLVGFADEYYFSRRFRQKTGMSPGQYALEHKPRTQATDWTGHTVEIPDRPRRIVYHGETMGDLLALGIRPVGGDKAFTQNSVFKHRLKSVANVGFPLDPAVTRSLKPDLIILASPDEQVYETAAGIAPTLTFDTFAPLEQRMRILGEWFGKQQEAEAWIAGYTGKNAAMWSQLYRQSLRPGESATVLIYDHGDRLFAMGTTGLSSALYVPGGFRPPQAVKSILDADLGFAEISPAQLPHYAGDRLFMLVPIRKDSRAAMERLIRSRLWRSLPAVQRGCVYLLDGAKWNFGDALTREKLIALLPKLFARQSDNSFSRMC